ncbi:MAG: hypothetical protein D6770_04460 [Anaerolineae bacterium]|nr:MAG: hypothetical protein D6770_04460 [Anaerolineae bacterium]
MVSIVFVFWMLVVLFGFVGAIRGWAKELLVTFSVFLSLAFSRLLESYVPFVESLVLTSASSNTATPEGTSLFWTRAIVLGVVVFFGYQTVYIPRVASRAARERLQDTLLGLFLGAINGYLIAGTLWYYLSEAHYPFNGITDPAQVGNLFPNVLESVQKYMPYLPPRLLGEPWIYFVVFIAFIFVLVVYI